MELINQNGAGPTPAAATMAAVLAAGPTAPGPAATGPAAAPAVPTVVDLDAGQTFGSVSYVVKRPFKLLGIVYNGLSFREPVGRDLKAGTTREQLACILGNFPPEVMAEMHAGDVIGVVDIVGNMLAGGPSA